MKNFLDGQDLDVMDVMSAPTEQPKTSKNESTKNTAETQEDPFASKLDFLSDIEMQEINEDIKPSTSPEKKQDQDKNELTTLEEIDNPEMDDQTTEQSSAALIDIVDLVQKGLFGFWGTKKIKKKIPDSLLEEMVAIDLKELQGFDLDDVEKKKLQRYKDYNMRVDRFVNGIAFTEEEKEELLDATKVFVKKQGIKIPPSVWFFTQLAHKLSSRFIDVAQL